MRIVANAGGLNPAGLADAVRALAERLGIDARIAHVEGDDLLPRAAELGLGTPLTANAYLGAWGIVDCLNDGADVVVTGRVTDASVIVGAAAAHFGWGRTDYNRLAGAVVAGHVIECGVQATGGNYAFFTEVPDLSLRRLPAGRGPRRRLVGDHQAPRHRRSGQRGHRHRPAALRDHRRPLRQPGRHGPDGHHRAVRLTAPTGCASAGWSANRRRPRCKVSLNSIGGFRNAMTFVLTGLDIEAKAELVRRQLESSLTVKPAELQWTLARTDHTDADTEEAASALLHCVVRDPDPANVGRQFSSAAVELALASYPGFT